MTSLGDQEEITLKVRRMLGAASPYVQGGSLRITLPRQISSVYGLDKRSLRELERKVFVFFETDKGILLMPLERVVEQEGLANFHTSASGQV
jgi:hypothetical protein